MDCNARMFVHQHHFSISREVQHLVNNTAIRPRQARGFAGFTPRVATKAQGHAPCDTIFAMAAKSAEAGDNSIAHLDGAHFAAHRLDDARRLMPGDCGQRMRIGAFDKVQVAMAQPAGRGADQHLMRPWIGNNHLLDLKRLTRFNQDSSLHRVAPISPLDRPSLPRPPCLPNSIRAMARACTSSGPSAKRKVR